jgi:hypothetical protein
MPLGGCIALPNPVLPSATIVALMLCGLVVVSPDPATAEDCPTAASAASGFVVERGERSKTQVVRPEDAIIRTILRYNGQTLLETTMFEGLFELDRLDRGRRTVFRPKGDLARLFPLKVGSEVKADFENQSGEPDSAMTVTLHVDGKDVFYRRL